MDKIAEPHTARDVAGGRAALAMLHGSLRAMRVEDGGEMTLGKLLYAIRPRVGSSRLRGKRKWISLSLQSAAIGHFGS